MRNLNYATRIQTEILTAIINIIKRNYKLYYLSEKKGVVESPTWLNQEKLLNNHPSNLTDQV